MEPVLELARHELSTHYHSYEEIALSQQLESESTEVLFTL